MSTVIYAEGTVIAGGEKEIRIYIKGKFRNRLRPLIGREVRLIILVESNEGI
ncbi:hypothetical protein JCM16161A_06620 [Vulcanisaeta sp. JCM 16161]|uniref:hypothetical protein n=1 Tax=Vulcanisaeta sp. JCM 16161 TaxID=1295372 RepID=UPI000A52AF3C|nr:hypothetical protein [Vulcanisaeta sp. JCM 16161]